MRIVLTLLALLGFALAQADHSNMNMSGMGMKGMSELDRLSGRNYDIAYMSMMIAHHRGAVRLSEQALKTAKSPQVRAAAQKVIADQNKEIAELTGWLRRWYNTAPNRAYMDMMTADMQPLMDRAMRGMMPGHTASPDRVFLEGMIPHHQDAVAMSRPALTKTTRPELRRFAQRVIDAQSEEIKQYREWLKAL